MISDRLSTGPKRSATFLARFENLGKLREFVGVAAQDCGMAPKGVYAVELAVDEACANIIEYGYGGECQEQIECTCYIAPERLTITLKDCGIYFNPNSVSPPDLKAPLEEREVGGLGLYFIHQLMDEVHYHTLPDETGKGDCNILTLVKYKEEQA